MLGEVHHVRRGENLWKIAKRYFGSGSQWPRIYDYNNQPDVIAVTGKGIADPDLILVGQTLLIPTFPGLPPVPSTGRAPPPALKDAVDGAPQGAAPAGRGSADAAAPAGRDGAAGPLAQTLGDYHRPTVIKVTLERMMFPPIPTQLGLVEFRLSGECVVRSKSTYPFQLIVNPLGSTELQGVSSCRSAVGELFGDARLTFDWANQTVAFRCMAVMKSSDSRVPTLAIGALMGPAGGKLRAEIRFPPIIQGELPNHHFSVRDLKVIIELTPSRSQGAMPGAPALAPAREPSAFFAPAPGLSQGTVALDPARTPHGPIPVKLVVGALAVGTIVVVGGMVLIPAASGVDFVAVTAALARPVAMELLAAGEQALATLVGGLPQLAPAAVAVATTVEIH